MIKYNKYLILIFLLVFVSEVLYANNKGGRRKAPARQGSQKALKPSEQLQGSMPRRLTHKLRPPIDFSKPVSLKGFDLPTQGAVMAYQEKLASNSEYSIVDAVSEDEFAIVKFLVQEGIEPDVNSRTNELGYSLLIIATERNNIDMVNFLLEAGADVNFKSSSSHVTTLHKAKTAEIARTLIKYGAEVNAQEMVRWSNAITLC